MKNLKPTDITRIKKSWQNLVPDETPIGLDNLDILRFKRETVALAEEVLFRMEFAKTLLLTNVLFAMALVAVICANLFSIYQNPILDHYSQLALLHALTASLVLCFLPQSCKEEITKINDLIGIFSVFYLNGLRRLRFSHENTKLKLIEMNAKQSKRGFEASWKCVNKNGYLD